MSAKSRKQNNKKPTTSYLANLSDISALAKKLGKVLGPNSTLGLVGELGSGKTTFTKHLAIALGSRARVTSPTFTLMNQYATKRSKSRIQQILHVDLYRTKSSKELTTLGLSDTILEKPSISVVEWADRSPQLLKKSVVVFFTGIVSILFFLAIPREQPALAQVEITDSNQIQLQIDHELLTTWSGKYNSTTPVFFKKQTQQKTTLNPSMVYAWVKGQTAGLEQSPVEPVLEISNNRAVDFTPPSDGINVDAVAVTKQILQKAKLPFKENLELTQPVFLVRPKASLASTNNLGIKELVARGESSFAGSSQNRRTNVSVGFKKVRGAILAPGEIFSFNDHLGSVEAADGFKPEIVIKRTGLAPELGGGICQVSSTTFRAAMAAGLPILERKNHSFAVKYYSPQGTDATTYTGAVDLKFQNDTPANLLVWAYLKDSDHLVFELWGTKDDRVVTLDTPLQYDKRSDGSMKAEWTRHITKNGVSTSKTFYSTYVSPALFQKKEEFIPAVTPPTTPGLSNEQPPVEVGNPVIQTN